LQWPGLANRKILWYLIFHHSITPAMLKLSFQLCDTSQYCNEKPERALSPLPYPFPCRSFHLCMNYKINFLMTQH
jgi:hypothetical protein